MISDHGHESFLVDVLPKQGVEIFIAASLPACKWSRKISRALKLFINPAVFCKLFAIVKGQCFHPNRQRPELVHNGKADQVRCLVNHLGHDCLPAFLFHHGHNRNLLLEPITVSHSQ